MSHENKIAQGERITRFRAAYFSYYGVFYARAHAVESLLFSSYARINIYGQSMPARINRRSLLSRSEVCLVSAACSWEVAALRQEYRR